MYFPSDYFMERQYMRLGCLELLKEYRGLSRSTLTFQFFVKARVHALMQLAVLEEW